MGEIIVAKCGRYCSDCQFLNSKCLGCLEENAKLAHKCLIFECAVEKGVRNCLNCPVSIPNCELLAGLNISYCLVVAMKSEQAPNHIACVHHF